MTEKYGMTIEFQSDSIDDLLIEPTYSDPELGYGSYALRTNLGGFQVSFGKWLPNFFGNSKRMAGFLSNYWNVNGKKYVVVDGRRRGILIHFTDDVRYVPVHDDGVTYFDNHNEFYLLMKELLEDWQKFGVELDKAEEERKEQLTELLKNLFDIDTDKDSKSDENEDEEETSVSEEEVVKETADSEGKADKTTAEIKFGSLKFEKGMCELEELLKKFYTEISKNKKEDNDITC